jgi:hypothetical protein
MLSDKIKENIQFYRDKNKEFSYNLSSANILKEILPEVEKLEDLNKKMLEIIMKLGDYIPLNDFNLRIKRKALIEKAEKELK